MMQAMNAKHHRQWIGSLLGGLLVLTQLGPSVCLADPSLRYQRASGRIERRDERASGRIEHRQERAGSRVERRDERISNRIDRRDMLFSPPSDATVVSIGGVQSYRVGEDTYQPAFYEGQTVYVKVDVD